MTTKTNIDNGLDFLAAIQKWISTGLAQRTSLTLDDFTRARNIMVGYQLDLPKGPEREFLEKEGLGRILKPLPMNTLADLRQAWIDAQKLTNEIKRNTEAIHIFKLAQKFYDNSTDEEERLLAFALRCEIGAVCFQMSAEAVLGVGGGRAIPAATRTVKNGYLRQLQEAQLPDEQVFGAPDIAAMHTAAEEDESEPQRDILRDFYVAAEVREDGLPPLIVVHDNLTDEEVLIPRGLCQWVANAILKAHRDSSGSTS